MRLFTKILLLLAFSSSAIAQDTTITILPRMEASHEISLGDINGWLFRQGNDTAWAKKDLDVSAWKKMKPSELSEKLTDKKGKLEGWFRLKIKLDTAFRDTTLDLFIHMWAASEIYLDGKLLYNFGNTGRNGKPFKEFNPLYQLPVPFHIEKGNEHTIAVHFVDFISSLPPYHLKSAKQGSKFISITTPQFRKTRNDWNSDLLFYSTMLVFVNVILCMLFWLLAFQNRGEKNLLLIALATTAITLVIYCETHSNPGMSYFTYSFFALVASILRATAMILFIVLMLRIFKRKITWLFRTAASIILIGTIIQIFYHNAIILTLQSSLILFLYGYYIIASWKTLEGAQWAVLAGILSALCFGMLLSISIFVNPELPDSTGHLYYSGLMLSIPLSLLVYVAMRFKEIINEVRQHAQQVVQLSEEKKEQALNRQKILQEEVDKQTAELRSTLDNLKSAQAQLIQSEKMASLGELTAGIAHEIQNPLNFVNNFSEVSSELLDEMKNELATGNGQQADAIAHDVKQNLEKIIHHGKRADAIVKGMLMHSRASSGQKELTDINALADEYLRLSYHGLRAKDKTFQAKFETHFDQTIEKISIIPQDIGRVLLNLFTNAFYSVTKKNKHHPEDYEPCVSVSTKRLKGKLDSYRVEIRVKDNGMGIPQKVMDKIFQPFFTTKPTGEGTGLGLSLSYDIITKGHGGELRAETKEGEFAEFIILLPAT